MAKITYESDRGLKLKMELDENLIKECDSMGIKVWQEVLETVRKEVIHYEKLADEQGVE